MTKTVFTFICSYFIQEDIIAVAAGDKNVCFYDIANHFEILQWEAHTLRVKSLCLLSGDDPEEPWLVSASSDGLIKLWKLQVDISTILYFENTKLFINIVYLGCKP